MKPLIFIACLLICCTWSYSQNHAGGPPKKLMALSIIECVPSENNIRLYFYSNLGTVSHVFGQEQLMRFKKDFGMDEKHWRACCIAYACFGSHTVSAVLDENRNTSKNRLTELRKTFGLPDRGNIQKYLQENTGSQNIGSF